MKFDQPHQYKSSYEINSHKPVHVYHSLGKALFYEGYKYLKIRTGIVHVSYNV